MINAGISLNNGNSVKNVLCCFKIIEEIKVYIISKYSALLSIYFLKYNDPYIEN